MFYISPLLIAIRGRQFVARFWFSFQIGNSPENRKPLHEPAHPLWMALTPWGMDRSSQRWGPPPSRGRPINWYRFQPDPSRWTPPLNIVIFYIRTLYKWATIQYLSGTFQIAFLATFSNFQVHIWLLKVLTYLMGFVHCEQLFPY